MQPYNFTIQNTTIWSFPDRGSWATHSGKYRGNWSPYIPRNLILLYSKEGDCILDQFLGSGTTLIEAKLLSRNAVGFDVNENAIKVANENLKFTCESESKIIIKKGSATDLGIISDNKIDLICTHPPYSDIIKYSDNIENDLSLLSLEDFINQMYKVGCESYRVLKKDKICAVMMGDIRRKGKVVPLGFEVMQCFIKSGFMIKEIIIKEQHNCRSTSYWNKQTKNFLMLAHEYIFVFQK